MQSACNSRIQRTLQENSVSSKLYLIVTDIRECEGRAPSPATISLF